MLHPDDFFEARNHHYQQFLGPLDQDVMHSIEVTQPHVDIYQFAPTAQRPFWTLITSGMSDERQIEPSRCEPHMSTRAELLMYAFTPKDWMFNVLYSLALMPFQDRTCLHWGHTVQNGCPMTDKPSLLTSFFFMPPILEPDGFASLTLDGDRVDFLWMVPITEAERKFAVKHGSKALMAKFAEARLPQAVKEGRQSIV